MLAARLDLFTRLRFGFEEFSEERVELLFFHFHNSMLSRFGGPGRIRT